MCCGGDGVELDNGGIELCCDIDNGGKIFVLFKLMFCCK
jgi:hypothetical protein